jgi:sensor histidine kinase regulating citrate/malate metabolism
MRGLVKREKIPFIVITVINSSRKNPFEDSAGVLTTNKPERNKHGFGLKSIQKIVDKYHGDMQMYYNGDTMTFHTIITLKIQE